MEYITKTMQFIPELRKYLREHRTIYTVRKYDMSSALVLVNDVGPCRRIPISELDAQEDLKPYVAESGFSSTFDWWTKIKEINPRTKVFYLYKVEVMK